MTGIIHGNTCARKGPIYRQAGPDTILEELKFTSDPMIILVNDGHYTQEHLRQKGLAYRQAAPDTIQADLKVASDPMIILVNDGHYSREHLRQKRYCLKTF